MKSEVSKDTQIHILIVDDDPYFLDSVQRMLTRQGYAVTIASNITDAIELLKEYHDVLDVIITDFAIPRLNGIDFALTARKIAGDTPIILFTGRVDLIHERLLDETGINEVVSKPCKIKELDRTIRRILGMNEEACL